MSTTIIKISVLNCLLNSPLTLKCMDVWNTNINYLKYVGPAKLSFGTGMKRVFWPKIKIQI